MAILLSMLKFDSEQELKLIRPTFGVMLFSVVLIFSLLLPKIGMMLKNFLVRVILLPMLVLVLSAIILLLIGQESLINPLMIHSPLILGYSLFMPSLVLYFVDINYQSQI